MSISITQQKTIQYNTDETAKYHWPNPQHYELNLKIQSSTHILVDLAFISHECNFVV